MKNILLLLILVTAGISSAQQSNSTLDAATNVLRVPNLIYNNTVYDYLDLQVNESELLDVITAAPSANGVTIPPDSTFVFLDSNTLVIPILEFGGDYYYNVELTITPNIQLSVSRIETQSNELLYRDGEISVINSATVISSNINSIKYPDSYLNTSTLPIELIAPECNLLPSSVVYPSAWMGDLSLPSINGAPFDSSVELGLGLKDIWQEGNPAYNDGCEGSIRDNFTSLIKRAAALNASYIEIFPWTYIEDSGTQWRILNPLEVNTAVNASTIPDEDIAWIVQTAHEHGIKVHWRNQIQALLDASNPDQTQENMQKFLPAYDEFMLERADFLQSVGVDAMQFDCTCWFDYWVDNDLTELYRESLGALIVDINERFTGTLFNEHLALFMTNANIKANSDRIFVDLQQYLELTAEQQETLNVADIKASTLNAINGIASQYTQLELGAVDFVFEVGAPSRNNFFQNRGYVETSLCMPGTDPVTQQSVECEQEHMTVDMSLQARIIEGQLEAIKEQTVISNYQVSTTSYWQTATIIPKDSFPNLDQSVRNKPAEKILQIWFDN